MTSTKFFGAFSLVVTRGHSWSTRGHSWSLVVVRGHSWSLVVTRGHSCVLLDTTRTRAFWLPIGRELTAVAKQSTFDSENPVLAKPTWLTAK